MDNRQRRTVEAHRRVIAHLKGHPIEPEPPMLVRARLELEATAALIDRLAVEQMTATSGYSGADLEGMRSRMRREMLMPLVRIAKPALQFAPGVEKLLRVPHARASAATLAAHALALSSALQPHAGLLADAGYPREFLAEFTAAAGRLATATNDSAIALARRARATAGIRDALANAMAIVSVIEGIVMARGAGRDPNAMKNWRDVRRVHARTGRPRKGARPSPGRANSADSSPSAGSSSPPELPH